MVESAGLAGLATIKFLVRIAPDLRKAEAVLSLEDAFLGDDILQPSADTFRMPTANTRHTASLATFRHLRSFAVWLKSITHFCGS